MSAFALSPVCAQGQDDAVDSLASALRSGQFEAALQLANRALASDPNNIRILTLRAIALAKLGKPGEALSSYRKALDIDPAYVPALAGAAELEFRSHDEAQAATRDLDRLLELRPGDRTAHAMRAVLAWRSRDCPLAVRHFGAAGSEISPQPAALHEYGSCLVRLSQPAAAVKVFQQLRELNPADRGAALALASVQVMAKDEKDAIDTLGPFLSGPSADAAALEIASAAYEALGDTPKAVSALREAIVRAPDRPELYLQFSSLCFEHNSFQVGIDMLNAGLTRLPSEAKLYIARGVMNVQKGDYSAADADFQRAEILDPREAAGPSAQALSEIQGNRLDDALKTVQANLSRHPNDPFFLYLLAEILTKRGAQPGSADFSRAVQASERAVKLKPDFVMARDVLSRLYLESGNPEKAAEQCRQALLYNPHDETALYRLIRALKASRTERDQHEIPALVERLAKARELARQKEAEASRYRLVEERPASSDLVRSP